MVREPSADPLVLDPLVLDPLVLDPLVLDARCSMPRSPVRPAIRDAFDLAHVFGLQSPRVTLRPVR